VPESVQRRVWLKTFTEWKQRRTEPAYLIDITKDIFTKKDEEGKYLVDVISG